MDCEFQEQAGWGCTRAQHVAQTVKEMAEPAQLSVVLNLKQPTHPTQPLSSEDQPKPGTEFTGTTSTP